MPELPEMEALRRALDAPVSAFPIAKAGPAHVATLKTFDPPLRTLEGRRLAGAERRGKRLLFPTVDGELALVVHLMTAGRLRYLRAGEAGPKKPAFQLAFDGGGRLVMTEAGSKKRAGVWLLTPEQAEEDVAHLGPEALGLGAERLAEILRRESRPLHPLQRLRERMRGADRAADVQPVVGAGHDHRLQAVDRRERRIRVAGDHERGARPPGKRLSHLGQVRKRRDPDRGQLAELRELRERDRAER